MADEECAHRATKREMTAGMDTGDRVCLSCGAVLTREEARKAREA